MERKKITFDSFIRGVILGVIIIGILMLFKRLSGVLLPFFIAWLIAYLIYPLVTFFQYRLRLKNRVISIFCALFSILIVRNRLLSACASHDGRIRQGKRFGNRLLFQRNPRRQCAQNTL